MRNVPEVYRSVQRRQGEGRRKPKSTVAKKGTKSNVGAALYIEWVDACAEVGWSEFGSCRIVYPTAVGICVYEDEEQIVIAATVDKDACNAQLAIPKAWIKTVKELDIETKQRKSKRTSISATGTRQNPKYIPTVGS